VLNIRWEEQFVQYGLHASIHIKLLMSLKNLRTKEEPDKDFIHQCSLEDVYLVSALCSAQHAGRRNLDACIFLEFVE